MSAETNPPRNSGLTLEQAFKRWGDPQIHATWLAHEDARQPVSMAAGVPPNEKVRRHTMYAEARQVLEDALRIKLMSGEILASGLREGSDGRTVIKPSLWEKIDYDDFDHVHANGISFESVEYFPATDIPSNIEERPDWLPQHRDRTSDRLLPDLRHSADYRHVSLGDRVFIFGGLQAKVVQQLHLAAQSGDPWRFGKTVLMDIGAESKNMGLLFKRHRNWQMLIESDKRGSYRLRPHSPQA